MSGTKSRSSYKRKRKGKKFTGRQRYEGENRDTAGYQNMSNDNPTSPNTDSGSFHSSNPNNVSGTSRKKMRCESRNDNRDNHNGESIHEYILISFDCLSNAVSETQHVCEEGMISSFLFYTLFFKLVEYDIWCKLYP